MRLTATRRAAALLLSVWFVLLSMDLPWLDACPMHGASVASVAAVAPAARAHAHAHTAPAPAHPADDAAHQCLCLGACHSGAAAQLPVRPALAFAPPVVDMPLALVASRVHRNDRTPRAYALPFATAPPQSLS